MKIYAVELVRKDGKQYRRRKFVKGDYDAPGDFAVFTCEGVNRRVQRYADDDIVSRVVAFEEVKT